MNILTKNRILQEGDEVFSGGMWGPVPSTEFGLQIEFSKYGNMQIRRPSEPDSSVGTVETPAPAITETKDAGGEPVPYFPAKPESKTAVPTPAEAPAKPLSETYEPAKPKKPKALPTVVSKKAHAKSGENITLSPFSRARVSVSVPYSDLTSEPVWIGRNGTFKATAVSLSAGHGKHGNLIQIRPVGARGLAKNALIEIPAADIPRIVDFLLRHQPAPK